MSTRHNAPRTGRRPAKTIRRRLTQTRALHVLKEVAEALNSAPTEQRVAAEALSRVADLLGVETGWVWLRDPGSGQFYSAAVQHLPPYLQQPVRMTGRSCWCLELFRSGRLTSRNIDVLECSRLAPAVQSEQAVLTGGLRCHASVPLYAGDRPLGVMNLATESWRRLTRTELDLLTTIAAQVGVAIERARLGQQSIELARADERSRIAREIHDTLAQGLTAVALQIEAGLSRIAPDAAARPPLERALEVARQSLDEARRSVMALRASSLEDRSLADALGALSRRFTADTGVRVRAEISDVGTLPPDLESELFRIASEALTNIGKHARAREASLRLEKLRDRLRLSVADAGVGFPMRGARRRGFGLLGIEDRARLVGGRATIRSIPGHGTVVTVTVPLPAAPEPAGRSDPGAGVSPGLRVPSVKAGASGPAARVTSAGRASSASAPAVWSGATARPRRSAKGEGGQARLPPGRRSQETDPASRTSDPALRIPDPGSKT